MFPDEPEMVLRLLRRKEAAMMACVMGSSE